MPRIAKSDVNAALSTVAKALITASGPDGRTSRADVKAALKLLPKEQRPLADIFFKFVDQRDFKTGATVTAKDINKAVAYAKSHMIAKYDLNSNGLSKDEIAKMSLTGKRAVELARALKRAGANDDGGKLSTKALGVEVNKYAAKANYMSESDYSPEFVSGELPAGHDLTGHNVMTSLAGPLTRLFEGNDPAFPGGYTAEAYSAKDAKAFIEDLRTDNRDEPPDEITESASAFGFITRALEANLTDLKVYKIGPKEAGSNKLASDQGLYAQVIVGRTADGKLAGIMMGDVET
ncbi:MAG: nuclease A inhibitor family protein [Archangium sp.]|nr:nuclease A inhibitor family protein [Archangium sp.]